MKENDLVVLKRPDFIDVGTVLFIEEIEGERVILSSIDYQGARYWVNVGDVKAATDNQIINMLAGMMGEDYETTSNS